MNGKKNGGYFHWDSPWIHEKVLGDVAELESILVSNPYGITGRGLEVEAIVVWADTPSGKAGLWKHMPESERLNHWMNQILT